MKKKVFLKYSKQSSVWHQRLLMISALDLLPFLPHAQHSPGAYQPLISALF